MLTASSVLTHYRLIMEFRTVMHRLLWAESFPRVEVSERYRWPMILKFVLLQRHVQCLVFLWKGELPLTLSSFALQPPIWQVMISSHRNADLVSSVAEAEH